MDFLGHKHARTYVRKYVRIEHEHVKFIQRSFDDDEDTQLSIRTLTTSVVIIRRRFNSFL